MVVVVLVVGAVVVVVVVGDVVRLWSRSCHQLVKRHETDDIPFSSLVPGELTVCEHSTSLGIPHCIG
jgi:hypothetical protein